MLSAPVHDELVASAGPIGRLPADDSCDHATYADAFCCLGQGGESDTTLQAWAARIGNIDGIEVVEGPCRLEQIDLVCGRPHVEHVLPVRVLRLSLDGETHQLRLSTGAGGPFARTTQIYRVRESSFAAATPDK